MIPKCEAKECKNIATSKESIYQLCELHESELMDGVSIKLKNGELVDIDAVTRMRGY